MKKKYLIGFIITILLIIGSYTLGQVLTNQQLYNVKVMHVTKEDQVLSEHSHSFTKKHPVPKKQKSSSYYKTGLPNFKDHMINGYYISSDMMRKTYAKLNNPNISEKDLANFIYNQHKKEVNIDGNK